MDFLRNFFESIGQGAAFEARSEGNISNIILSLPPIASDSFCYLIPEGFRAPGTVLVISPYVNRINQEIEYLRGLDISATTITSETSIEERENIYDTFSKQFFFVTPEMIAKGFEKVRDFINDLLNSQICLVAVEEADLSTENFREAYQVLSGVRRNFPNIPWIALTSEPDINNPEIATSLSMANPTTVRLSNE